jgi:hypothetical protein
MGNRKPRDTGPQRHAEGQHGEKTHRRFIEQLQESRAGGSSTEPRDPGEARTEQPDIEGHHRLHQDREQHDEAEKNSEKVEAMREIQRGHVDENVIAHARVPHEGDSR